MYSLPLQTSGDAEKALWFAYHSTRYVTSVIDGLLEVNASQTARRFSNHERDSISTPWLYGKTRVFPIATVAVKTSAFPTQKPANIIVECASSDCY